MKINIVKFSMVLLLLGLFISCSKDENQLSNGEKIGQDIKSSTGNKVSGAAAYEYKWDNENNYYDWVLYPTPNSDFKIEGSFINIGGVYFNLNNLERYYISGNVIYLFFSINQ